MTDIDGNALTMSSAFGTKGFFTLEPNNSSQEEQGVFTGLTNNANGTTTLTGVSNVTFLYPYTESSGLTKSHPGGATLIISNTSGFYDELTSKDDDETINGTWTFTARPIVPTPINPTEVANKAYVDGVAIAGAPNASTSVQGLVQEATQAQVDAKTATGSTGAKLFQNLSTQRSTLESDYVADTGSANTYVIAPSPAISAYATGQRFSWKAASTNSGASTLNVNTLGTKNIFKRGSLALAQSDIIAGLIVDTEYDGTQFQMLSQGGNAKITTNSQEVYSADTGTANTFVATLVPAITTYNTGLQVNFVAATGNTGASTLNVNGLGAKNIKRNGNTALVSSEITAGLLVQAEYDGTSFQPISPLPNTNRTLYNDVVTAGTSVINATTTLFTMTVPANTFNAKTGLKFIVHYSQSGGASPATRTLNLIVGSATFVVFTSAANVATTEGYATADILFGNSGGTCDAAAVAYAPAGTISLVNSHAAGVGSLTADITLTVQAACQANGQINYYGSSIQII